MAPPQTNPFSPPAAELDLVPAQQRTSDDAQLFRADRGSRLGAALLDFLLYVGCAIPGVLLVYLLLGWSLTRGRIVEAAGLIYLCVLPLAIYQWYRVSTTGQSLGKKWLGLRIVKMDGSPVDFVSGVLLRVWAPAGISIVLGLATASAGVNLGRLWDLADALVIFAPASRCIHDYFAGTKVVRTNAGHEDVVDLERFG